MAEIILNGITWGHSRGITPLLAVSQRFTELNPHVQINWKKRTLQQFADYPIEKLTEEYDLLIIDHPWVGCAAATGCVLPLDEYLPEEILQDQYRKTVGDSHMSYQYNRHQWALAVDAATPAASYRADLLQKNNIQVPQTWEEVIALAEKGVVAAPAIPIDLLMNFYMFCIANGNEPFASKEEVIDFATGIKALETMRQLYSLLDMEMFESNPIAVAEKMSRTDNYWYCPFAYCYSNYSRAGYADHLLTYNTLVQFNNHTLRSTIGGTGLSVSTFSKHKNIAVKFAEMVASGACQSGLYVENGGQPGHLFAWTSEKANMLTNNFFKNILPVMESGYLRPRYNCYLFFQDHAGKPIQKYLCKGGDAQTVLNEINELYKQSQQTRTLKYTYE